MENPRFHSKLLELINSARQQDVKSNIQKWVAFLYTNNDISEREYKLSQNYIKKYLVINHTKKVKDIC